MNQPEGLASRVRGQAFTDPLERVVSQQVSWWLVHELVEPVLARVGSWPLLGTPVWGALDGDDPRRWAAVLDGAQHWALHLDLRQEALACASRDVANATNWCAVARWNRDRRAFVAAHPWAKRAVS
ncbi:phiRv1 phage protein [Mycobacteroides abscessus subsp. abscessus]|uniref:DUF2742 domain-containing protein n=1 Tax=Mycobacteroides abscessus TaxID=36809 RepID=UPI00092AF1EF|nr:DUF2742 domain-containing protein [Mycobacteroides abscessus]SHU44979.1 phiRv1 phage protein [Mycobacteroides abscessus subsp. abscessus]SHZ14037.1 phiRv1 phage protein [Mycobacteroides abscessus subsp. abscessus]SKP31969.1 phiRv1 phage protein [Mycobacteroides abscessus subsp. abscessus]